MNRWKYVHPAGRAPSWHVATAALLIPCMMGQAIADWPEVDVAVVLLVAAWGIFMWRYYTLGVAISKRGIRLRRILSTRIVPWATIARLDIKDSTIAVVFHRSAALWIIPVEGPPIEAPVIREDPRSDQARTLPFRARAVKPKQFDQMVAGLRATVDQHRSRFH